jgi:hypothetical protein
LHAKAPIKEKARWFGYPAGESDLLGDGLEGNSATKQKLTGLTIRHSGIAKPGERTAQPSILKERIYAEEVGMVKDIQRRGVELKRHALIEFNGFESREVADAGHGILLNVATHVTERGAENRLGASAIQDITNVIAGDCYRCAVRAVCIERIDTHQRVGKRRAAHGLCSSNGEEDAGIRAERTYVRNWGIFVTEEGTG